MLSRFPHEDVVPKWQMFVPLWVTLWLDGPWKLQELERCNDDDAHIFALFAKVCATDLQDDDIRRPDTQTFGDRSLALRDHFRRRYDVP